MLSENLLIQVFIKGWNFGDIGYKSILILAQVAGYTLSKFAGIKVISELKASDRVKLIILLILVAEIALLFFGLVPYPYNFIFLFINGLPLGMVYGVVFSFLEGRRFTEMIAMGLNISIIAASGNVENYLSGSASNVYHTYQNSGCRF